MWKDYWRRWLVRWREAIWNLSKDAILLLLALLILFVQFKMGWIRPGTGWAETLLNIGPTAIVLLVFLFFNALKAVVLVDRDREGEVQGLTTTLTVSFEEWSTRIRILDVLYRGLAEGIRLVEMCKAGAPNAEALIKNWDDHLPKLLVSYLGEQYRRSYYEGPKGESQYLPDNPDQWEQWIRDRNTKLRFFIEEFQQMPGVLLSWEANRSRRLSHTLDSNKNH